LPPGTAADDRPSLLFSGPEASPVILILTLTAALTLARFDAIRADVPGQPVHIAIDVPDLARDAQSLDPERILLSGKTESGCIVSILYEENFPFVASKEVARRFAAGKRVQSFTVGEISCCEFKTEIRDTIVETRRRNRVKARV
jgi:hypothetical protein